MIGMVLPQGMWAGVTIDTSTPGKVIVTSENAGDFATYLNNATTDQLNSLKVDEIVFVGKFNASDLSTLQSKNCATQKKVDMSATYFIKSASSANGYTLYHSTPSNPQDGKFYVIGAKKYIGQPGGFSLQEIEQSSNPDQNNWNTCNILPEERSSVVIYSADQYYRLPTTLNYYQKVNNQWMSLSSPNADQISAAIAAQDQNTTSNMPDVGGYPDNTIIKVRSNDCTYKYYKSIASFEWKDAASLNQDYNDGEETSIWYPNGISSAPSPTDYNSKAYVDGYLKVCSSGQLVDPSQAGGDEEYDYTQMRFDYWGSNVEEIITSNHAEGPMADQLCSGCSNLKTLTLSAGDFTGSALGNNITHLETVNIQNQVTALGSGMFNQAGKEGTGNDATQHLTTVTFQDGCQIRTLPNSVFKDTGIRNLSVPSSVELIEAEAFSSCQSLETVTFVNTNHNPLVIKNNAFQQSDHIKDIYLNVNPSERLLICEYDAFDYHSMEGQTAEGSEMATLHFAEENFDYYAGEWKKGMSFTQADLNSFKDGIEIKDDQGHVIYAKANTQDPGAWGQYGFAAIESYGEGNVDGYYHDPNGGTTKYAPANGWQQFAKTASDREIEIIGNVYMTYSTDTPYSLPKGIVAFRVTDYKEAVIENGKTKNGRLVLKQINQVPTETGMLLISTDQYVVKNATDISVFYFGDPVGTPAQYHYKMGVAGDATSNYLAPAVHGIAVGPTSKGEPNPVTGAIDVNGRPFDHRNFAMSKSTHQFVRVKKITMPDNRAFLSLPTTMFTNDNESATEGPNPWNTKAGDAFSTYETTQYDAPNGGESGAKTNLFFEYDVEQYGMIWPLIKDDSLTGVTTGIKNVNVETVQEGIYTLQGVKVSAPSTKGIYIVNGKKVIIK